MKVERGLGSGAFWSLAVAGVAAAGIAVGLFANWRAFAETGRDVVGALWLLPALVCLHLGQLFLAGVGWRALFMGSGPGIATFYRLRIVREGIDSLLPVAQVGGEVVGFRLLSRQGVAPNRAAASVIVDVTVELLTQLGFLAAGLATLSWLSRSASWGLWQEAIVAGVVVVALLILAQRLGILRMLEALARGMARRWPALAGASLDGLHGATVDFYRRPAAMFRCTWLHALAWMLGSIESWAVLYVLGVPVTAPQAFTVESLGMAARSAGFAIPAALGAQEGGFILAAAAVGLAAGPALALSVVKRLREILVGLVGLALWGLSSRQSASWRKQ